MKQVLSSQQLPLNASTEILGRAYHATETFVQVLSIFKYIILNSECYLSLILLKLILRVTAVS
jgi:hypothetical protein